MHFKGKAPTKADGKRKERKIIEKLGKEVFTDNVSVSIVTCLPETTFKLYSRGGGGISFLGFTQRLVHGSEE